MSIHWHIITTLIVQHFVKHCLHVSLKVVFIPFLEEPFVHPALAAVPEDEDVPLPLALPQHLGDVEHLANSLRGIYELVAMDLFSLQIWPYNSNSIYFVGLMMTQTFIYCSTLCPWKQSMCLFSALHDGIFPFFSLMPGLQTKYRHEETRIMKLCAIYF